MTTTTKGEYVRITQKRYKKSNRKQKNLILNEFIQTLGIHRKSAIRLLSVPPDRKKPPRKPREFLYGKRMMLIIESWWRASGFMCGQRLKASLDLWLPALKKRFPFEENTENDLRKISASTIDRRLAYKKKLFKKKLYGSTKPGMLLRHQIPIRTEFWNVQQPGFVEIDLVSHCGFSAAGEFAHTLNVTDIFSQWVERRAVLGKGERGVAQALDQIRQAMPFVLLAIDSDNGSEFINKYLIAYCKAHNIGFTRSRPYKKDDNAHIEQKNFTHVRKIFGWVRFDHPKIIPAINELYAGELRLFQNFFQPNYKLKEKIHIGSRRLRRFEIPKTPFQRLKDSPVVSTQPLEIFETNALSLDPFSLQKTIQNKISNIYKLHNELKNVSPNS
jgi:hypothetical protein